jgi:hypothetical protein
MSQSELPLIRSRIWSSHGNATVLAATPPTDSESGRLDLWEAFRQSLPLYGWFAVNRLPNTEDRHRSTQASRMRQELRRHSSRIDVIVSPNTGTDIPHR